ncbi:cation/H(+) antiporter 3-like [Vigna radiata var. radiata]|uniref:Cation/H(+) antiporter 3-like n=1 Tax=Vigna radiata var. radiata TaxID=3916 RepID=A0A1S3W1B5_VIGRR|nr:cation/H(+) antiporter 3-like [Vigna radiata var. radiata]
MDVDTLFASINEINVSDHTAKCGVCLKTPPNIASDGLWGKHSTEGSPLKSSMPIFLLQVVLIYTVTRTLNYPLKKLGFPAIFSQLMAGLILGPSLSMLEKEKTMLFPYGSQDTLATIASLGYMLFVFENGVKMDFSMITRTGRQGWIIAIVGLLFPLVIGYSSVERISKLTSQGTIVHSTVVILMTQNMTSFTVIASVLNDLQILNSELGRLALSSALVGDTLSNILVIASAAFDTRKVNANSIDLVLLFAIIIIIFFVYRPAMFLVIEHTPESQEVKDIYINVIIGVLFVLGWCSMLFNIEFILLPFLYGLATPDGPPLGSSLVKRVHTFGLEFLMPIFVTTCAMKMNYSLVEFTSPIFIGTVLMIVIGHLMKLISYLASALFFKLSLKDALSLALLLDCKGVVEVAMYSSALDKRDIQPIRYTVALTMIMISNSVVQLLVKRLYDPSRKYFGYQKRNMSDLKFDSNLRILVCIHKHHHTVPIIPALDLFNPTPMYPTTVDVLHLIELVGRSSPIFISHKMKRGVPSFARNSYSENVILSFKLYEDEKLGATTMYPYTAISPPTLMHEDVCYLALDKVASIIILPFHRRWSFDGKIEHEDKTVRLLNCKVMDKAPCSVGILVTRFVRKSGSPLRLAMIFFGGDDDREALCLANRAAKDTANVNLVVYHITTSENKDEKHNEDIMLDRTILKNAKRECSRMKNVVYEEITVEGGAQVASVLHRMAEDHDFFIVGRRHGIDCPQTKSLQEWSEFPELGVIGDFLASPDLDCKSSVLVVQQQKFYH